MSNYSGNPSKKNSGESLRHETNAAYNFIPFAEQPLRRYEKLEDLPPHSRWNSNLLSGEIRVTIKAITPIFVGSGDDKRPDFYQDAEGRYTIPGSTLRGLLRENMQILGFGAVRPEEDYQNYRILYRKMAAARGALDYDLKGTYNAILGFSRNVPPKTEAGFLYCKREDNKDKYYIRKVDQILLAKRDEQEKPKWKELYAKDVEVFFKQIGTMPSGEPLAELSDSAQDGFQHGWLHGVGRMQHQNALYVFPDPKNDAEIIDLSDEDVANYREDFESRKNSLKGTDPDKSKRMNPEFWNLPSPPQDGNKPNLKPVFYLLRGTHVDFGVSRYLRLAYEHDLQEGLPAAHQAIGTANSSEPYLDYPYSIMGFAAGKAFYRSRVSVGDFHETSGAKSGKAYQANFGEPKLSFFPAYVVDGKDYSQDGFQLRGYKQYWFKPEQNIDLAAAEKGRRSGKPALEEGNEESKFASWMNPLRAGRTSFSGTVRYRNLNPDELGLLLWCLTLDKGCQQSIGRGKPYGYGRVEIHVDSLWEYDPKQLYGVGKLRSGKADENVVCDPEALERRMNELQSAYFKFAKQALGFQNGIRNVSSIRDFLGMKKVVCKAGDKRFDHMKIEMFKDEKTNKTKTNNEFKNLVNPLPTAAELLSSLKTETPKQAALPVGSEKVGDVVICKVVGSNNLGLSVELGSGKKGSVLTKSLLKPINQYKTDSLLTAKIQSDRFGLITLSEEKK